MSMYPVKLSLFAASALRKPVTRIVAIRILALLLAVVPLTGQVNRQMVMTWNQLNFPDHHQVRIADIGLLLGEIEPDILVINEMKSATGVGLLYNQVLQPVAPDYIQGPFVANDNQNNAIFYNSERSSLLGSVTIPTALSGSIRKSSRVPESHPHLPQSKRGPEAYRGDVYGAGRRVVDRETVPGYIATRRDERGRTQTGSRLNLFYGTFKI